MLTKEARGGDEYGEASIVVSSAAQIMKELLAAFPLAEGRAICASAHHPKWNPEESPSGRYLVSPAPR